MFKNLTRSLGILVIAMKIEDAKDIENLWAFGVDKFQGTYTVPVALLK